MADSDQRRTLSRFHLWRRGECAGPRASASGRSIAGTGDETVAHVEPVQESGWRAARGTAVRGELRRPCVFRKLRRRGDGMRDQDHAQISRRQGPRGALSHHHLRRRISRPHASDAGGDRVGQISRGFRAADGWLRSGHARRPRRRQKGDRSAHRGHPERTAAGRGRRTRGAARLLQGVARAVRRQRPAADLRRGADRHGPHRRPVRVSTHRRYARCDAAGESARRWFPDRCLPGDGRGCRRHDAGLPRFDLRRQSAGGGGGQCGAGCDAQARLLRARAEDVAAAQAEAGLGGRSPSEGARRSARRRAADRSESGGAVGRSGDGIARAKAAHGRRRRKRGAVPAAVDRDRGGDRRIGGTARARLRRSFRRSVETGGGKMSKAQRHFLDLSELPTKELRNMLALSVAMKAKLKAQKNQTPKPAKPLEGKTLAMIFEKPSTRTRVSFDVGMRQLGGESIMLTGAEMQLGRGETIADTARVLSRYVDAIMIRILNHEALLELAAYATVPVINGLTRRSHPCQVMADLLTFEEHRGPIEGRTVAWSGDDNNVLASWAHAAERFRFNLRIATPPQLAPKKAMRDWIKSVQAPIIIGTDPEAAVRDADCVVTDTWVSMGDKDGEHRHNLLKPYQVNAKLMSLARPDALFMHCLPAHRGEEVTDEVIDGPQSVVFDEAENRLHAQKGILAWCFNAVG